MNATREKTGQSIAGSRFFRSFCKFCNTPMRVVDPNLQYACERCSGRAGKQTKGANITPRQAVGLGKTTA